MRKYNYWFFKKAAGSGAIMSVDIKLDTDNFFAVIITDIVPDAPAPRYCKYTFGHLAASGPPVSIYQKAVF